MKKRVLLPVLAVSMLALAVPVLAHRLIMSGGYGRTGNSRQVIEAILDEVKVPTEDALIRQEV